MEVLGRAKAAHNRTKQLLQQYNGTAIPPAMLNELQEGAAHIGALIDAVEKDKPISNIWFVETMGRSIETADLLWQAIIALEGRISALETAFHKFKEEHSVLLLRQMGYQLQNKIARRVLPGNPTPYDVRHETLPRLKKCKKKDEQLMQAYLENYDIENGIDALNTLGVPIAHPEQHRRADGQQELVTVEVLADLVQQHFKGSTALESVQDVLACLVQVTHRGAAFCINSATRRDCT
mmetsp:Transcript_25996/g.56669  ORF Transcript_25996/g.56669 Transcript_25996/m.56669 type:complete len:237 (-) Transcript_25996:503-1213(-)|eukprot:CAMPEP_0202901138 /NCGR_PEP_ID=MMETSP1392-20130828/13487_1 /ASSEMBLY_ACC=CAM_ASM_000868 /TAXON_ID=225041 /ORGANISM="Chlamydomonas chlamydogama, Strain SAG 11-48b" /LENGTH=236 /DNA_ID=CAMNT_0049587647 /DNA_START=238 /DNA_END=948 /DNA_ORIENTATION=+